MLAVALALALAGQEVRASVSSAASTVEVGQPVRLEISLAHPVDSTVELLPEALGSAWVLLDASGTSTLPDDVGDMGAGATTRVTWTVCALEPAEGVLPALVASVDGGAPELLAVGGDELTVIAVLAQGEDLPRPPLGFREPPLEPARRPGWPWALGALALVGLVLAAFVRARRKRAAASAPPPTPLERLGAIEPRALEQPEAVQAAYFEITAALRSGIDQRLGRQPPELVGLTDEEWLRAIEGQLPEAEYELVVDLLRESEPVKYGSTRPTHWGLNETLERARAALAPDATQPERQELSA